MFSKGFLLRVAKSPDCVVKSKKIHPCFYGGEQLNLENGRKVFKQVENTVGKGEIARYERFLLFLKCFQRTCTANT